MYDNRYVGLLRNIVDRDMPVRESCRLKQASREINRSVIRELFPNHRIERRISPRRL